MKTIYYTLTTWEKEELAAGFDGGTAGKRQAVLTRQPDPAGGRLGGDNVIDLTQWRWGSPDEPQDAPAQADWEDEAPEQPDIPAPRPRRSRRTMMTAELVSTLSVVAAALALIVRVLTF